MSGRYAIGIDPGIGGAIVILQSREMPYPLEWCRMPACKVGKSSRVDGSALARRLEDYDVGDAYVEHVHAMPGQGVTSMFTFGHACGVVEGVLASLCIPYTLVTPQRWKRAAGLMGKDKDAARTRAAQLWPRWGVLGKKAEGQALADAALIARFGVASMGGGLMATTGVCFVARDAEMFKKPTWKSRRPGRTAADAHKETPATQVDIFCHERAGLIERMARLAGSTTWRDPSILPTGQASEPWNDWLNSACVWLHDHRTDATDVTGDILHALAVMWMPEDIEDRVVNVFAAALADRYGVFGHLRSAAPGRIDAMTRAIVRMCTYGVEHPWPRRATRAQIGCAQAFGVSMYWAQADAGVRRAREALEGM